MKNLITYIKDASIININYIDYGDVYTVLNSDNINYGACVVELELASRLNNIMSYNIRLTIVDRLTEDENNILDVFENTTRQLNDLLYYIQEKYDINENYTINYIKQDFTDKLAGIYTTITIYDESMYCQYQ